MGCQDVDTAASYDPVRQPALLEHLSIGIPGGQLICGYVRSIPRVAGRLPIWSYPEM